MLGKKELNEMYENMAKLLLMAENPSIRFADLQDPGKETMEHLNEAMARVMSAADAAKSENPELQSEGNRTYQEYRKQCRGVIRKFSFEKEALYALGKSSDEMSKEEQDQILLDPQNAGKIRKLMENVAECIQKAERTQGLSEYLKKGELRHSSKIDYVAGQAMGLAEEYGTLEREWIAQKGAEKRPQEKRVLERPQKQAEQETTAGLKNLEEVQNTKSAKKQLHAVPAPAIKGVEGLPAWERLINWIAEKLGFHKVFSEKKENQKQNSGTQTEYANTKFQDFGMKSEWKGPEREVSVSQSDPQRAKEEWTSHKSARDLDYEKQIQQLQIENLRKDSMIKYLQGELLRVQIIEQNLKNEKLLREIAEKQNKQKEASGISKADKPQNSRKPEREKISFSQLAKEDTDAQKKRPKLETLQPQKARAKDDSMIDYRHRETPEKHKKALSPSR